MNYWLPGAGSDSMNELLIHLLHLGQANCVNTRPARPCSGCRPPARAVRCASASRVARRRCACAPPTSNTRSARDRCRRPRDPPPPLPAPCTCPPSTNLHIYTETTDNPAPPSFSCRSRRTPPSLLLGFPVARLLFCFLLDSFVANTHSCSHAAAVFIQRPVGLIQRLAEMRHLLADAR